MKQLLFAVFWFVAPLGVAQETCPTPEILNGDSISFDELFSMGGDQDITKGEFETTAQFEARLAARTAPPKSVVRLEVDAERFLYDADNEVFQLYSFALAPNVSYGLIRTMSADQKELFGDIYYSDPVQLQAFSSSDSIGTYEASNAYGATTTVTRYEEKTKIIFEDKGRYRKTGADDLFRTRNSFEANILTIPVPIEHAPSIKPELKVVSLIEPKAPYYENLEHHTSPDMKYPSERDNEISVLVADIQCIGVLDGDGNLLASWKTR